MKAHVTIGFVALLMAGTARTVALAGYAYSVTDLSAVGVRGSGYSIAVSQDGRNIGTWSAAEVALHTPEIEWPGGIGPQPPFVFGRDIMPYIIWEGPLVDLLALSVSGPEHGVRDSGLFVGSFTNHGGGFLFGPNYGLAWQVGSLGGGSRPFSVNDAKQIAGTSETADGTWHAFLDNPGKGSAPLDLGTLGGRHSAAYDINAAGEVVGSAQVADGTYHAFLYDGATMQDLGTLGADTYAARINDWGQIVGRFLANDGTVHGFLYSEGAMQDLGAAYAGITDINNSGQIVASSPALLREPDGSVRLLNDLIDPASGWLLQEAHDINDAGQIVGYGIAPDGQRHAFLLTPIPEPSTLALLAIGSLGLLALAWRQRSRTSAT